MMNIFHINTMTSTPYTQEFYNLIRAIGETKSKQEEDKIITKEIAVLKHHFDIVRKNPNQCKSIREYLIRMLYCELLGHQASFGYFFAVTLTSTQKIMDKRMGYLATSLCLPKDHELVLLLTHNMQKDLKSSNQLEISTALTTASKIITEETIPALLPRVLELKTHHFPLVRKKAYMFIHSAYKWYPELVSDPLQHAKDGLCDRDPSVMGASLCLLHEIVSQNPKHQECKSLVESLVGVLRQIVDHRLSSAYDYHRLPAPWIQMKILSILAILGKDDKVVSEQMFDILGEVMRRADIGLNIGHAIVFESIRTIASIYPLPEMLELAASATARFMQSKNQNLKYLGIQALTLINNPRYANQHQSTVIDCLEDRDETIKRSTLSLLYTMTNENNVTIITNKLLEFARKELDKKFQEELIFKICSLAEKFAPDNFWYIDTVNDCFEVDAGLIPSDVILTLMTVIAEGSGEDLNKDEELRVYTVEIYFEQLQDKPVLHDVYIQVIAWVLGEYGYLSQKYSQQDIISALCDVAERRLEENYTRSRICSALLKLTSQIGKIQPQVMEIINKYLNSKDVDLQQRCYEFSALTEIDSDFQLMKEILPLDGSCQEVDVDSHLHFASSFVQEALRNGAQPYLKEEDREFEHIEFQKPQLKIEYENTKSAHILPFENPNLNPTSIDTSRKVEPERADTSPPSSDSELRIASAKKVWFDEDEEPELATISNSMQEFTAPVDIPPASNIGQGISGNMFQGMNSNSIQNHSLQDQPYQAKRVYEDETKKPSKKTTDFVNAVFGTDGGSKKGGIRSKKQSDFEERIRTENLLGDPFDYQLNSNRNSERNNHENSNSGGNIFDFDDMMNANSNGTNNGSTEQSWHHNDEDIYNSLNDSNSQGEWNISTLLPTMKSTLEIEQVSTFNPGKDPLVQSLQFKNKPVSDPVTICNDGLIEVTEQRFRTSDSLTFVFVFQSKQGQMLTNIFAEFQPPAKFQMEFKSSLEFTLLKRYGVSFKTLEPNLPITLLLRLRLEELGYGTSLMGTFSYTDKHKHSHSNGFNISLNILDLMRPQNMDAQNFGRLWQTHTREKRVVIKHQDITVDKLKGLMQTQLQLNVLQAIENELIASAMIINLNTTILIHATAVKENNSIVFTVRSQDINTSSAIALVAAKQLKV